MNAPERTRWILLALVVSGFALRLALGVALGLNAAPEPGSDPKEYDTYAWNVAQGRGYRGMSPDVADQDHLTAARPPGISIVWAGLYLVFGHRYDVVRVANCLVGSVTILLVYAIGRRCFDETVGLLAAAGYAVYPSAIFFSPQLVSEPLGTFWFLWFVLACLQFAEQPSWGRGVWAGALLGVSILSRPNPALMVPLMGIWALWQFRGQRAAMIKALLIPVVAVAVLLPWWVRNYLVFHTFIPISTMSGPNLLMGNNRIVVEDPKYRGFAIWDTYIPEYRDALKSANDEVKRDKIAKDFAIQWLKDNPDKWLRLAAAKLVRGWTPFLQPTTARLYRWGMLASWGPVLVLFLIVVIPTLVGFLRSNHPGWIIHLVIVNSLIVTVMFWGESRYRHAFEPLCIVLAAQALVGFMAVSRTRLSQSH
jgi:4-amino-4-deoxy-L-arabinose transferase-like glycosyltransferase